jgi:hypothetical protein
MKAAIITEWTSPYPGREAQAMELVAECNDFYGKLAADGKIEPPEWYLGTAGKHYFIIRGELEELLEIQQLPGNKKIVAKSHLINDGFAYSVYQTGEAAEEEMMGWASTAAELGYA